MKSVRFALGTCALVGLVACQPAVPDDSRFGTGFDQTFDQQRVNRDTALSNAIPASPSVSAQPLPAAGSAAETAAQTAAILASTGQSPDAERLAAAANNSGIAPLEANPSNPAPAVVDNATGISRENNFDAVSGQRSIEGDAARIAANRAQYQVIQPQALPQRSESEPNIVAYALSTTNPVGNSIYRRGIFKNENKTLRNCSAFGGEDQAQIAFLKAGGPKRDRQGLDPDGDGYACDWDPSAFRNKSG